MHHHRHHHHLHHHLHHHRLRDVHCLRLNRFPSPHTPRSNYGEGTLPLDWVFGTFRDGLPSGAGSELQGDEHGSEGGAAATKKGK